jgi:hypothetical protein
MRDKMLEIHKVNDDQNQTFYFLWENSSEQYVSSFNTYDEARSYVRFLKRGGGFVDFTPSFMVRLTPIEDDEDEEVE